MSAEENPTKRGPQDEATLASNIVPRTPERRNPHRFQKGVAANPAGKPKGRKNNLTIYREAVLMKQEKKMLQNFPEIIDVLMDRAKAGDMTAMKLYLDRIMAAKKVAEEQEEKGNKQINIVIQGAKAAKVYGKTIEAEFEALDNEEEDGEFDGELVE